MRQDLQSIFIIVVAVLITQCLQKSLKLDRDENASWLAIWIVISSTAFLFNNFWIIFWILTSIKIFWAKNDLNRNMLTFLFLLPCLHSKDIFWFPLESLHILRIDYQQSLVLIFILPLLPRLVRESKKQEKSILFFIPLLYIFGHQLYSELSDTINLTQTTYANVIENTLTNKVRGTITFILFTILPFYAFAAWCNNQNRIFRSIHAIATSGTILMIIAVPCALLSWDIYHELSLGGGYNGGGSPHRGGLIRVKLTIGHPITFGKFAFMCLALYLCLTMLKGKRLSYALLPLLLTVPAIYFTQSRSAYIGSIVIIIGYFYFSLHEHSRKITAAFFLVAFISLASPYFLQKPNFENTSFDSIDAEGTFDYRKELIFAGLKVIPDNPFFGDPNYIEAPEFLALRQGEGIIDQLNAWLIMALKNGLIYLFMYLWLFLYCLNNFKHYAASGHKTSRYHRTACGAALATILLAYGITAFFDAFVSYIWIIYGIAFGVRNCLKKQHTQGFDLSEDYKE